MKRVVTPWRADWQRKVEEQGFPFHSAGVRPDMEAGTYWFEGAYYEMTSAEVDILEEATEELHRICLKAADHVCCNPQILTQIGVPPEFHESIVQSWMRGDPTIYGRFDLAWDGNSAPKMLEYNADTPTCLIESSLIQWYWLEEKFPDRKPDQFNSIHEKLIEQWRHIRSLVGDKPVYFSAIRDNLEEFATVEYMRDVAGQGGCNTTFIYMHDIGWNGDCYTDVNEREIQFWFKLYPWEWLWKEEFGRQLPTMTGDVGILEPPWKSVLSNKGILPILWEMFPGARESPARLLGQRASRIALDIEADAGPGRIQHRVERQRASRGNERSLRRVT
jgi:glutathionylspermidine synthase